MKKRKYTSSIFIYTLLAICAWSVSWLLTQALFMMKVPVLSDGLMDTTDHEVAFATYSIWIVMIATVTTLAWSIWSKRDFSFLKHKKHRWVLIGYIPVAILFVLAFLSKPFGISGWIWAPCIVATTFFQDILTFGFLQTALEKKLPVVMSALITAIVFFFGHFLLVGNIPTVQTAAMYIIVFPIFALLRAKTRTIYATDIIHQAFLLFMF